MTREEAAQICQSIKSILENSDYTEAVEEALNIAIEALEQEPKTGKWIATEYDTIKCGECGIVYSSALYPRKYCPNCGAGMREANKK